MYDKDQSDIRPNPGQQETTITPSDGFWNVPEEYYCAENHIDIEEEAQLIADVKAEIRNSRLNPEGLILYPEEERKFMWLSTLDGFIGFQGIRVGNWVVNGAVAVKIDPNGTSETISLESIFAAHRIKSDWRYWDNETFEFLKTQLPK